MRPRWLFRPVALLTLGALQTVGCGSNTPEIPDEYLQSSNGSGGASGASYPAGPFGSGVGDTAANFSFLGWNNPKAASYDPDSLETLSFADLYDPDGAKGVDGQGIEVVMLNTSAVWCSACRDEHSELPERYAELKPRGLEIFSLLFQNQAGEPADSTDLVRWTETFEVEFPMALDPDFQMQTYGNAAFAPINIVVDAKTMKILRIFEGNQPAVFWPFIESELAARGR